MTPALPSLVPSRPFCRRLGALALSSVLTAAAPAAMAAIDVKIDGLPAGLTATLTADQVRCTANGPTESTVSRVDLTEQTSVSWVQVPLPLGGFTLQQRTSTSYRGSMTINSLPSSGCNVGNAVRFRLHLKGESAAGNPTVRSAIISSSTSPTTMTTLYRTIEAKTTSLNTQFTLSADSAPVTSATRGQFNRWISSHTDGMGESAVVDPTLDFLVPGEGVFFGMLRRVARITVTQDRRVCIVATTTVCRTKSQGGTLSHAGIDVDVGDTEHTTSSTSASTRWEFRLAPTFPSGTVTARVGADDLDPILYDVDNVPTQLNLLPWKSLSVPVQVN